MRGSAPPLKFNHLLSDPPANRAGMSKFSEKVRRGAYLRRILPSTFHS